MNQFVQIMDDLIDDMKNVADDLWYGILTSVHYDNWTGYDYSAGQHGLETLNDSHWNNPEPKDLLDAAAMRHDFGYNYADEARANGVPGHKTEGDWHTDMAVHDEVLAEEARNVRTDSIKGEAIRWGAIVFFEVKADYHKANAKYHEFRHHADKNGDDSSNTDIPEFDPTQFSPNPADQESGYISPGGDRAKPSRPSRQDGNDGGGDSHSGTSSGKSPANTGPSYGPDTGQTFGGGGDSGDSGKPVVLDLDGDGVELVALEDSTAFYDIDGDGYRERVGWVSPDDGLLAYDKNGDGKISGRAELSFVDYVPGARTDLEGLRYFDSNGDGRLDAKDAEWGRFRVWRDLDQDGESDPGELQTLAEAGVRSIGLTSDGVGRTVEGNRIFGEGSYTDGDGPGALYDVGLRYSEYGLREEADGGLTVSLGGSERVYLAGVETGVTLDATALGVAVLVGHDGADRLAAGGDEGKLLVGGGGADTLEGWDGHDVLLGGDGADRLAGGGGNDVLVVDASDFAAGSVDGGSGNDVAFVEGETGVTVDLSRHGPEAMLGGGGADRLSHSGTGGVSLGGGGGDDQLTGGSAGDVLSGDEGADTLRGNGGDDVLLGGEGADTLEGGSGDDVLYGGAGADTLEGGAGDDVYVFGRGDGRDSVRDRVVVDGVQREAGAGDVLFLSGGLGIGDVLLRLRGGALEVALKDPASPSAAFDTLADRVTIRDWTSDHSKIETLAFGDGSRLGLKELVSSYGVREGGAAVDLLGAMNAAYGKSLPSGGNAYLGGAGRDVLVGGAGADVLQGRAEADVLLGGAGADRLEGGDGNDVLAGGRGSGRAGRRRGLGHGMVRGRVVGGEGEPVGGVVEHGRGGGGPLRERGASARVGLRRRADRRQGREPALGWRRRRPARGRFRRGHASRRCRG